MFCKQVNIPFIYALCRHVSSVRNLEFQEHKVFYTNCLSARLPSYANLHQQNVSFRLHHDDQSYHTAQLDARPCPIVSTVQIVLQHPRCWCTPLDESSVASMVMHDILKKKNRLDTVKMVFMTDGSSNIIRYLDESDWKAEQTVTIPLKISRYFTNKKNYTESIIYVNDPMTKKRYRVQPGEEPTNLLLKMLRDHTQANLIGFHILPARKPQALAELPVAYTEYQLKDKLWYELIRQVLCHS